MYNLVNKKNNCKGDANMKKIWATLGLAGVLSSSAAVGVLDINHHTNVSTKLVNTNNPIHSSEAIYDWADVNINHRVETKSEGIDIVQWTNYANKTTKDSWNDFFANSKLLVITGTFDLHTYTNPKTLSTINAQLNEAKSGEFEKVWEVTEKNDQWENSDHHTVTLITLTVTAKYDEKEGVTSLTVSSYIYARTDGVGHDSFTSSQINDIQFIAD